MIFNVIAIGLQKNIFTDKIMWKIVVHQSYVAFPCTNLIWTNLKNLTSMHSDLIWTN